MNKYQKNKNKIREEAMEYQYNFSGVWHYEEILEKESYLRKMGKRYGILRGFKENGICI